MVQAPCNNGNRLMALHLQDNGGKKGATTIEPMNWDYENLSIQKFLDLAYQRAKKIDDMRNT